VINANGSWSDAIPKDQLETLIYYSEWSAAAYCGPQLSNKTGGKVSCGSAGTCPRVEKSKTKIHSTWYSPPSSSNGATGFVAADHTNKNIVLSMRGSVGMANWIADVKFNQIPCPQFTKDSKCSTGFLGFWEESKADAMKGIKAGLAENPDYTLVVTGHSLGGAAAVYAAGELRNTYKTVALYTYGQPRAGNEALSKYITEQGNNFRVTHTSDAVPKLPPEDGLTGSKTGIYRHISPEYWISDGLGNNPEKIKIIQGFTSNDGNAGTGQMAFNIIAHIQYFQTNMYYCALPLPMGWMGGAGTKFVDAAAYDRATTVDEVKAQGFDGILTEEIPIPRYLTEDRL